MFVFYCIGYLNIKFIVIKEIVLYGIREVVEGGYYFSNVMVME